MKNFGRAIKQGFVSMVYWCQNQSETTAAKISFSAEIQKVLRTSRYPWRRKTSISNQWAKGWELEYGILLQKPNKWHSISKEDCIIRVQDYLKNIWSLRHYFIKTFDVDPPIINGDQISLHRNESSGQATLSFKNK